MTHKKAIINKVEIPAAPTANDIAAEYGLIIVYEHDFRSHFIKFPGSVDSIKVYRQWELLNTSDEQLRADITAAIDNYQPAPVQVVDTRPRRSPITGHFR